jgi:endonuclease III-like uncharacterized protein
MEKNKKNSNLTKKEHFGIILRSIQGIGKEAVEIILNYFNSPS